jgi:hypothetical protein
MMQDNFSSPSVLENCPWLSRMAQYTASAGRNNCNAVQSGRRPVMFRRNISPTSSDPKTKPSKKPARCSVKQSLLLDPQKGDDIFLRNFGGLPLDCTILERRRLRASHTPLWERRIQIKCFLTGCYDCVRTTFQIKLNNQDMLLVNGIGIAQSV